jgi:mxaJ protein
VVTPLAPPADRSDLPLQFDIAMGVRKQDHALRDRIDQVLMHRQRDIDDILGIYHVPRADTPTVAESAR